MIGRLSFALPRPDIHSLRSELQQGRLYSPSPRIKYGAGSTPLPSRERKVWDSGLRQSVIVEIATPPLPDFHRDKLCGWLAMTMSGGLLRR